MKTLAVHAWYETIVGVRNRTLLLMNYLMPLGFYIFMGGMMTAINPFFGDQLIPAMVVFAVLSGTVLGLPTPLVEARESGILRTYRVHSVRSFPLLTIPALSTSLHLIIVALVITATAPLLFASPVPTHWMLYVLIFVLALFSYSGLGILIGVISRNNRTTILWQQLLYLPSMLLGGLMVPIDILPDSFARLAHLLPATYAMKAFEGLAYGDVSISHPWLGLLVLFFGGLFAFALAAYLFTWDNRGDEHQKSRIVAVVSLVPYIIGTLLLG